MSGQTNSKQSERVIDENLRRVYSEAIEEGIPDRFMNLLAELKQQDQEKGSSK